MPQIREQNDDGSPLPLIRMFLARQARAAVDACLGQGPRVSGRLSLRLELPPQGGISRATVEAGAGDERLHRCVTEALQGTAMPSFGGGGTIVLSPFVIALCPDGTAAWPTSQGWR